VTFIGRQRAARSEERDALLAQALNTYTLGETWSRFPLLQNPLARVARTTTLRLKVRCWTYRH
jgi:hypothetical protein